MFNNRIVRRFWLLLFVPLIVVLTVSACGGPQRAIVGKWQQAGGGETIEFYKDGTVTATSIGITVTGSYKFIDDSQIRLDLSGLWGLAGPQIFEVRISGNRLTLKDAYGNTTEYTKVK
ncbi:MAG: hypothetical protein H8E47_00345 [Anaerolineales bacterium]|nr:hypothetical protein [Anaerolineales bacterium]